MNDFYCCYFEKSENEKKKEIKNCIQKFKVRKVQGIMS